MPAKARKLTATQTEVMKWLSQGWDARVSVGAAVDINGKRVCNLNTINALVGLGLVAQDAQTRCWGATAEGKKLSPSYQPTTEDDEG